MAGLVKPPAYKKPSSAKPTGLFGGYPLSKDSPVASAPAAAVQPKSYALGGGGKPLDINAGEQLKAVLGQADSPESPRAKAAKLMKRQAGIGQLTTRHVEEEPLI